MIIPDLTILSQGILSATKAVRGSAYLLLGVKKDGQ